MSSDGFLIFDTKIDTSGFQQGLAVLGGNLMTQAVNKVAELGKEAIQVGMNFETATSQLAATMGVSKSEITELIETAKDLGASTSFSATEAAEGLNILAMSGLSAEEQMASIGDVLNLAAAGSLSLADAASYTTGTIKGFGDSMDNAQYYTDLIAKGATLANTNVSDLGLALSSAAATAGNYGQSADSTALSLLRLAEQNVTGAEAATALNRAMMDLYTPTDAAKSALEELGVSAYDSAGNARDFNNVVDELSASMAGMSEEEANATKNAIFTTYGLQAFNKMTVSSTEKVKDFKEGLASASDGIGSAAQQAETMLDNLEGQLTIMGSAAEGLGIAIYESFSGSLTNLVEAGTEALGALTEGFNEAGAVGMAAAGAGLVYNLIVGFVEQIPQLLATGQEALQSFLDEITAALPDVLSKGVELLGNLANGILEAIPQIITAAGNVLSSFIDFVVANLPTIMAAGVNLLISLVQGIINTLPQIISSASSVVVQFANTVISNLPQILSAGISLIGKLAAGIIQAVPSLISQIPSIISQIRNSFTSINWGDIGLNIIRGIASGIAGAAGEIISAAKSAAQSALDAAKAALGINSPSKVFRDEVGKYMALGIGVGFEDNIPIEDMNKNLKNTVKDIDIDSLQVKLDSVVGSLQSEAIGSISISRANSIAQNHEASVNTYPHQDINYDRLGESVAKAMIGMGIYMDSRPVGKLVAPIVNEELGKIDRRKT